MSKIITIGVILAAVLGGVALVTLYQADKARSELPVLGTVGPFTLTDQFGEPFTDADLTDKLSVVEFFFTGCRGHCPIMNGHFADLYRAFAETDRVQFVSISVDPEADSTARLADYAARFGVSDRRWVFLTGPLDSIVRISETYFMLAADDLPGNHSTRFALVDGRHRIRAYYSGTDAASVDVLRTHLRELLDDLP